MDRKLQILLRQLSLQPELLPEVIRHYERLGLTKIDLVKDIGRDIWTKAYLACYPSRLQAVELASRLVEDTLAYSSSRGIIREPSFGSDYFFKKYSDMLTDKEWRLYSVDCAMRFLPRFEYRCNDIRPRQAIMMAKSFAEGDATFEELVSARTSARCVLVEGLERDTRYLITIAACSASDTGLDAARLVTYFCMLSVSPSIRITEVNRIMLRLADYLLGIIP